MKHDEARSIFTVYEFWLKQEEERRAVDRHFLSRFVPAAMRRTKKGKSTGHFEGKSRKPHGEKGVARDLPICASLGS
ncbi:MAG TPA: hypothetical protein VIT23_02950 [Terrimicrobiaceae bacterium]